MSLKGLEASAVSGLLASLLGSLSSTLTTRGMQTTPFANWMVFTVGVLSSLARVDAGTHQGGVDQEVVVVVAMVLVAGSLGAMSVERSAIWQGTAGQLPVVVVVEETEGAAEVAVVAQGGALHMNAVDPTVAVAAQGEALRAGAAAGARAGAGVPLHAEAQARAQGRAQGGAHSNFACEA